MKKFSRPTAISLLALMVAGMAFAGGGLRVEVGNPDANDEAQKMKALVLARVLECGRPVEMNVTATALQLSSSGLTRTPLTVMKLSGKGTYAIVSSQSLGSPITIEIAAKFPGNDVAGPRVLVARETSGIRWASVKYFFNAEPGEADVRAAIGL